MNMKKILALLMAISMTAIMTACSQSDSSSVSASGEDASSTAETTASETSTADLASVMQEIDDQLADYSGTPAFPAADFEKLDAKSIIQGKKIFLLCANSTNQYMVNMTECYEALVNYLGGEAFIYYADGTNDSWTTGLRTAISQKYDAVDIVGGATIDTLSSVIDEVKAAGIYIQDTHNADVNVTYNDDYSVGADFTRAMKLCALEAIRQVGDPAEVNALVIADIGLSSCDDYCREGITSVFDQYDVKYTIKDVAITDWTTAIAQQVRTAFISDPTINVIVAYYDNMLLYITPVLDELGISQDQVVVGSFNGSPGILDLMTEGTVDFDLGESVGWIASSGLDCMLRGLAGMEVYNTIGTAAYMINQDNLANCLDPETGKGSYAYDGVQDVYLTGYGELWGVDLTGVFDSIA
ncbi:MAG: ABC-type sugar transport system, periplasmic component [Oscillospiraceae bacterium]|nr:ABC-type sugar transport system, periplasmic component [Oscillospiraceae bacterium]